MVLIKMAINSKMVKLNKNGKERIFDIFLKKNPLTWLFDCADLNIQK
jgi:hypothetical protein